MEKVPGFQRRWSRSATLKADFLMLSIDPDATTPYRRPLPVADMLKYHPIQKGR